MEVQQIMKQYDNTELNITEEDRSRLDGTESKHDNNKKTLVDEAMKDQSHAMSCTNSKPTENPVMEIPKNVSSDEKDLSKEENDQKTKPMADDDSDRDNIGGMEKGLTSLKANIKNQTTKTTTLIFQAPKAQSKNNNSEHLSDDGDPSVSDDDADSAPTTGQPDNTRIYQEKVAEGPSPVSSEKDNVGNMTATTTDNSSSTTNTNQMQDNKKGDSSCSSSGSPEDKSKQQTSNKSPIPHNNTSAKTDTSSSKKGTKQKQENKKDQSSHQKSRVDASSTETGSKSKLQDSKKTYSPKNMYEIVLSQGTKIKIYEADITKLNVECIVNATNGMLSNKDGMSAAISKAAGQEFQKECMAYVDKNGNIPVSQVAVTKAGKLPCKCVIHAIGPDWRTTKDMHNTQYLLNRTIFNAIQCGNAQKMTSLAIPSISAGKGLLIIYSSDSSII